MGSRSTIKIVYWNAQSIRGKISELKAYLQSSHVDIMLLGETHLKPGNSLQIPNYITYRIDRKTTLGGGTAVLIKKEISHNQLPDKAFDNMEITGIQLETSRGNFNIFAAYLSPSKDLEPEEIEDIFTGSTPKILLGDLNAKHENWNSKTRNTKGNRLAKIAQDSNIIIEGPDEPTHIHTPNNSTDTLDIAILKNITQNYKLETIHDLHSDHLPIMLTLELDPKQTTHTVQTTDWTKFKQELQIEPIVIENKEDIDAAVEYLEQKITTTIQKNTTTKTVKKNKILPAHLKLKIMEKKKLCKKYQRTLHPDAKTALNKITNEIKSELQQHYNEEWENKLISLNVQDNSVWKTIQQFTKKSKREGLSPLETQHGIITSNKEKAEEFANTLEHQFKPNESKPKYRSQHDNIERDINDRNRQSDQSIMETTAGEITEIVKNLDVKKAPGKDGITNQAIKQLPDSGIKAITEITNAIITYGHFPDKWKEAKIIMIKKSGKPKQQPESYRPISLLSTISKVVERVIYKKLYKIAEEQNIIPNFQYGFRQGHSTTQQVIRLTEHINEKMNIATPTAAIFLDVEKAFDRVWIPGLIYKLKEYNIPIQMVNLIEGYLRNRSYHVNINNENSSRRNIEAGVPQGSILGPLLFNLYTADIPEPKRATIAQYADDTAIYYSNRRLDFTNIHLENDLDNIIDWYDRWKIKINPQKTTAVFFQHRRRPRKPNEIKLQGEKIKWTGKVKYLGITLDENLTYIQHIKEVKRKIGYAIKNLYPLLNSKSKLNIENKIRIIKTIIIPAITYAGEIWHQASDAQKNAVQRKINVLIRMAVGAPYYISNEQLYKETGIEPLAATIERRTYNTITKMEAHENITIRQTINPQRKVILKEGINKLKRKAVENGHTEKKKRRRDIT